MNDLKTLIKPYLSFYEALRDIIFITGLDGTIIYLNKCAEDFFEQPRKNFIGKKCFDVFCSPSKFNEWTAELGVKKKINGTASFKTGNKSYTLHQSTTIIYNENNIPGGLLNVLLEYKHTAGRLEKLESQLSFIQTLNYHTDEAIMISDVINGCNIFCSHSIERMMGWKPEDFIDGGYTFVVSLTHPEDVASMSAIYSNGMMLRAKEKFVHDHEPIVFIYRKKHKDGSWRWIRSHVFVLERNSNDDVTLTIGFLRDITLEKINGTSIENDIVNHHIPAELRSFWSGDSQSINTSFLTARERQVLDMVREGNSTKHIANALGLTIASVNSHRKKLMEKMKAKNTAELIRRSYEMKIFE